MTTSILKTGICVEFMSMKGNSVLQKYRRDFIK
jgi:hypothetical protein